MDIFKELRKEIQKICDENQVRIDAVQVTWISTGTLAGTDSCFRLKDMDLGVKSFGEK